MINDMKFYNPKKSHFWLKPITIYFIYRLDFINKHYILKYLT